MASAGQYLHSVTGTVSSLGHKALEVEASHSFAFVASQELEAWVDHLLDRVAGSNPSAAAEEEFVLVAAAAVAAVVAVVLAVRMSPPAEAYQSEDHEDRKRLEAADAAAAAGSEAVALVAEVEALVVREPQRPEEELDTLVGC